MGVDPVMAQGADEDQLARIRPALMALPPLVAVLRDGRSLLEVVAERPQSALDHIAVRQSAALGKQCLELSHRDLRTSANPRQKPITAAVQNQSANPAHSVGADRPGPLVWLRPSHNARSRHIEQVRNFTATPTVGARRTHALAKISRIGSGHACWPLHQWPL